MTVELKGHCTQMTNKLYQYDTCGKCNSSISLGLSVVSLDTFSWWETFTFQLQSSVWAVEARGSAVSSWFERRGGTVTVLMKTAWIPPHPANEATFYFVLFKPINSCNHRAAPSVVRRFPVPSRQLQVSVISQLFTLRRRRKRVIYTVVLVLVQKLWDLNMIRKSFTGRCENIMMMLDK